MGEGCAWSNTSAVTFDKRTILLKLELSRPIHPDLGKEFVAPERRHGPAREHRLGCRYAPQSERQDRRRGRSAYNALVYAGASGVDLRSSLAAECLLTSSLPATQRKLWLRTWTLGSRG